ncbi:hypothetical protein [Microbispora sp. NBRC 16548]|uniref:hypothetical protein n=1 Tax=Microbispora sp. NBRC 16548 TaxID=3030994 RepID=UPI001622208F|nr:hypothetical protein [Microbispora sp. NBRC 16548]GLX06671.1 hypothetical protein Misp03_35980 [Microbispora sp. NBRC 16548]
MTGEEPPPTRAEDHSETLAAEITREGGRTVRDAIGNWSKTVRLGALLLFAAGAFAIYHSATSSSQEDPPQCRIDVVLPAPAKAGGEQHV